MKQIIEAIAANHLIKWSIWKDKRLYIKDTHIVDIYNTRKCKQDVYIDLSDGSLHCFTGCPEQGNKWIENENNRVIDALAPLARLIRIACKLQKVTLEPVEVVMNNATLAAQAIQGYFTEWRQVRIAINRFGKLAVRNRQFVVAFKGTMNDAPRGFVALSDAAYKVLSEIRGGEVMLEPYANVPDYEAIALKIASQN